MKSTSMVLALVAVFVLGIVRPAAGADWWPPFGKKKSVRSPLLDGKPLVAGNGVSTRSSAKKGPTIWRRMGDGTRSAMQRTKNLITFKMPKRNTESKTVSQYPSWDQTASAEKKSSRFGTLFRRKPKESESARPSDWIARDRPGFGDADLKF